MTRTFFTVTSRSIQGEPAAPTHSPDKLDVGSTIAWVWGWLGAIVEPTI